MPEFEFGHGWVAAVDPLGRVANRGAIRVGPYWLVRKPDYWQGRKPVQINRMDVLRGADRDTCGLILLADSGG